MVYLDDVEFSEEPEDWDEDISEINVQDLLDRLTESYRMVFNLFVLEDHSHKEIAEMLSISEVSSKTQLLRAKNKLREMILEQKNMTNEQSK